MKKLTKEEFVKKSLDIHGIKYDYNKVIYVNNRAKITITCSEHGDFNQSPADHLLGRGCSKCGKDKLSIFFRLTKDQFVERARKVHGEKYDYSQVEYVNFLTKIKIICPEHGEYEQTPGNHLSGNNCVKCGFKNISIDKQLSTEEFVEKAKNTHGDLYDYSLVEYVSSIDKVIIICLKHDKFEQKPSNHLMGQGCPCCSSSKGEMLIKKSLDESKINYQREYKLPETPHYRFRYDFYLPDRNLLIEFHGIQHYKPIPYFGGEESFKDTLYRDKVKKSLAKETNRKIIYFNYKQLKEMSEKQFQEFLLKAINKFKI